MLRCIFIVFPSSARLQLYTAGGYHADEVALFTLQDAGDGEAVLSSIATHIAEQGNQFQSYVPKEVGKLDHALTYQMSFPAAYIYNENV